MRAARRVVNGGDTVNKRGNGVRSLFGRVMKREKAIQQVRIGERAGANRIQQISGILMFYGEW